VPLPLTTNIDIALQWGALEHAQNSTSAA
jgi:hypothetical protein